MLKVQLRPYNLDIENLNQYMNELRNSSPYMAEALAVHVAEINQRWNNLLKEFENREVSFVVLTLDVLLFMSWIIQNYLKSSTLTAIYTASLCETLGIAQILKCNHRCL